MLEGHEIGESEDLLVQVSQNISSYSNCIEIGLVDTQGNALWTDLGTVSRGSLADEPYFKEALAGENVVTGTYPQAIEGIDVSYYAVPVRSEAANDITGVLFAATPTDDMRDIIDRSLYEGKGFAHVIDSSGNYIVESESPLVVSPGDSIFNLDPPLPREIETDLLNQLALGNTYYAEVMVGNVLRYVAFEPLSYNDWYVFYSIPEADVQSVVSELTFGSILLIVVAIVAFMLFAGLIWRGTKRSRKNLEEIAFVDTVTNHENYRKFLIDAEDVIQKSNGTAFALCYEDIKGFKHLNDLFGRDTGTRFLKYWADAMADMSYPGELFALMQDDTFVSLRIFNNKRELDKRCKSLMHKLEVYPETITQGYKIDWYCGVYIIGSEKNGLSLEDMIDRASLAHNKAKWSESGSRIEYYSDDIRERKLWEASVEAHMEPALEAGEFVVYLQPKIALQQGDRIKGAEALVRWRSPEFGFLTPGDFISLFERNGFVVALDKYIFEETCRHYKDTVIDGDMDPYEFSVNVSRKSLLRLEFITSYAEIKSRYHIPDGIIELEFTESLAVENVERFKSVISLCHSIGFRCSMDDFGSGYSSLNALKSLEVDVLKLDRAFFKQEADPERSRALIQNTIRLAKDLGWQRLQKASKEKPRSKTCAPSDATRSKATTSQSPCPSKNSTNS